MSVSKPKSFTTSPATCFLKFNLEDGTMKLTLRDSDKEYFPKVADFVILDEDFKTIGGWNANLNKGIRCNVCHGVQDFFRVSYDGGERIASGSWDGIKVTARNAGGRYVKQVYALLLYIEQDASAEVASLRNKLAERKEIVKIDLGGLALAEYMSFAKRIKVSDMGGVRIRISEFHQVSSEKFKTKKFMAPTFMGRKLKDEEGDILNACIALDEQFIEPYRNYVLSGNAASDEPQPEATPEQFAADNGLANEKFDPNWQPPTGQGYFPSGQPEPSTANDPLPF